MVEPSIQFTVEREKDRRLSFLDLNFIQQTTGIWRLVFIENPLTPTSIWLLIFTIQSAIKSPCVTKTLFMRAECLSFFF